MPATLRIVCTTRTRSSSPHARSDIGWLLDQLQAEQAVRQVLQGRLDRLVAAIGRANERLNALPWQGDGLGSFFADGLDRDRVRWVGQVFEDAANVLDPETLGLKDGNS
jgi:hypothetical protein